MQYGLSTMFLLFVVLWSSLAVFGVGGAVVFVLAVGLAILINRAKSVGPVGCLVALLALYAVLCMKSLVDQLLPAVQSARGAARRMSCMNNMKQIALALQEYHRANGCFPPAYIADKSGKPIHSWRVLILPYVEGAGPLYKQYNFSEPWDGPNNKKLLARRPKAFACPGEDEANPQGATETSYVAAVGANAAWRGEKPRTLGDFRGADSDTIMLVEATEARVQWTEPKDLSLDALAAAGAKPPPVNVSSQHGIRKSFYFTYSDPAGANVALADGTVQFLPPAALAPNVLPKLLRIGGCTDENLGHLSPSSTVQRQLNWDNIVALAVWLLSVGWLFYRAVRSRKGACEFAAERAGGTEARKATNKNGSDEIAGS